jgi:hypothetical protein
VLPVNFVETSVCTGRFVITFVATETSVGLRALQMASLKRVSFGVETEWFADVAALRDGNM